jgi:hypothetical protein
VGDEGQIPDAFCAGQTAGKSIPLAGVAAGCRFDFSAATIKPLIELVRTELVKLG